MSDWITSGADAPCLHTTSRSITDHPSRKGAVWRCAAMATAVAALLAAPVAARDRGQFANSSPEIKSWFGSLRSGRGPCCSDADGSAVSDVDWESSNGHYKVRLEGVWFDVPDDAVITVPNKVGRTMVWPVHGSTGTVIRCFMPGSMT